MTYAKHHYSLHSWQNTVGTDTPNHYCSRTLYTVIYSVDLVRLCQIISITALNELINVLILCRKKKNHATRMYFHVSHGPRNIVKRMCYHHVWKNKTSLRAEKDDTFQITKVMTYTAWEDRLWGTDSDIRGGIKKF